MELEHSELAEKGEHGTSDTGTSVYFLSGRSRLLLILLALVALVFFIVGIALIASAVKKCQSGTSGTESSRTSAESGKLQIFRRGQTGGLRYVSEESARQLLHSASRKNCFAPYGHSGCY